MPSTRFLRLVLSGCFVGAALVAYQSSQAQEAEPASVPYCSVGLARGAGLNRTMWDIGEEEDTCEAALVWLGEDADWQVSGEFSPTEENRVELRCYLDQTVYRKTFTGVGVAPFEEAASDPAHDRAACLVMKEGDAPRNLRYIPPTIKRGIHQFSVSDEMLVRELAEILRQPGAEKDLYELPSLTVDKETGSVSLYVPQDPRDVETSAAAAERERVDEEGFEDDDAVHEEVLAANGWDDRSLGDRNEPSFEPSGASAPGLDQGARAGTPESGRKAKPLVKDHTDRMLFGSRAKIGGSLKTDLEFKKNGDGYAKAEARAYLLHHRIGLITAELKTRRLGNNTPTPDDDRIDLKSGAKAKVLGKTVSYPLRNAVVDVDHREKIGPEDFTDSELYKYIIIFFVGPVPMELKLTIRGKVGLKEDYIGVALDPQDVTTLVMHAGVRPYAALVGEAIVQPLSSEVQEEYRVAHVATTATLEFVSATFVADADWNTRATGPCVQAKMLRPTGGKVHIGAEISFNMDNLATETIVNMVGEMCDFVEDGRSEAGGGERASPSFALFGERGVCGPFSDQCEKLGVNGTPSLNDFSAVTEAFQNGADITKGNLAKVLEGSNVEALRDRFLEGCRGLKDVVVTAGRLTSFVRKETFYKYPKNGEGKPWGREKVFFTNDSCRHFPPPTTLEICNKHPASPIDVAVVRHEGGQQGWVAAGWQSVAPASCRTVGNFSSYTGPVYIHGWARDRQLVWGRDDASFCVNRGVGFQHAGADTMACSGAGLTRQPFTRKVLEEGKNRFTLTADLPTVKVCNDTAYDKIFAAVGYLEQATAKSSGWFSIPRGSCHDVLRLADGPIYGFATVDTRQFTPSWAPGPNRAFCVRENVFEDLAMSGDGSCPSGALAKSFHRISGSTWRVSEGN